MCRILAINCHLSVYSLPVNNASEGNAHCVKVLEEGMTNCWGGLVFTKIDGDLDVLNFVNSICNN